MRGGSRRRLDPLWTRAPLLLAAHPGAGAAVALSVFVLVLASVSAPLFVSSAAGAAFRSELDEAPAALRGLRLISEGVPDGTAYGALDAQVRATTADLRRLAVPTATLHTLGYRLRSHRTGLRRPAGDLEPAVPYWREGALDAAGADPARPGAWVPRDLAEELGLESGQTVTYAVEVITGDAVVVAEVEVPVAGTYPVPDLADDPFWSAAAPLLPRRRQTTEVAPLLLMDRQGVLAVAAAVDEQVVATWEAPLATASLPLAQARALALGTVAVTERGGDVADPLGLAVREFGERSALLEVETVLPDAVGEAQAVTAALVPPLQALSLAGQTVALGVTGAAAALLTRQRRGELRLLAVQGASPSGTGLRAPLEVLPAVLAGALAGAAAGVVLVRAIGPSAAPSDRFGQALQFAVIVTALALLVIGVVTAVVARGAAAEPGSAARAGVRRVPWEAVALALAAAGAYQVLVRGPGAGRLDGQSVDLLVVVFPLLAIAGLVGLAARGLRRLLPRLGRTGAPSAGRLSVAVWLAARRVGRAGPPALLLVTGTACALGVLVYALALAASSRTSTEAKTAALVGSAATADVDLPDDLDALPEPGALPAGATLVWRGSARAQPGRNPASVLAVDPRSFPAAARWRASFAAEPLDDLLARISKPGGPLPVLLTGRADRLELVPRSGVLSLQGLTLPYEVVARTAAFPGSGDRPLTFVADVRQLSPRLVEGPLPAGLVPLPGGLRPELWSSAGPRGVAAAVAALGVAGADALEVVTPEQVAARPDLLAQRWILDYLVALGVGAGLLAAAGLLLHLDQRRAARATAYALTRRMGLPRRAAAAAVALEVGGLLGTAMALGVAAALPAVWLVALRLDPLPQLAPAPRVVLPGAALAVTAAALLVAVAAGTAVLQWRADRADVGEVLRVAE